MQDSAWSRDERSIHSTLVDENDTGFCLFHGPANTDLTVKAEIFGGVLFSVTSVPTILPKL